MKTLRPKVVPVVLPSAEARMLGEFMALVGAAAASFEGRWSLRALRRVDPELYALVMEQQELYHEALVTGEMACLKVQAEAMVRGWNAATRRMEEVGEEDDAYVLGLDTNTGTVVAIGDNKAIGPRVRALHPRALVFTPDEVATMASSLRTLAPLQAAFPGAELVRLTDKDIVPVVEEVD
jgi:hypothetical protein